MRIAHDPLLVLLSLIVAIQASYVGLRLAARLATAEGLRRRVLLSGAAGSLAVGIWGMHFVGMLAARLPMPVDYIVLPTLLSFLLCVLVVGLAILAASMGPPTKPRLAAAAVAMGGGIALMHYTGMQAIHASAHLVHHPAFVAASLVVAVAASGLALWLAFGPGRSTPLFGGAIALGLAISGMHYVAMAGLVVHPYAAAAAAPARSAISPDLLAIVVAVVAFLVSGLFFLTLVPDRSDSALAASPAPAALPQAPLPSAPATRAAAAGEPEVTSAPAASGHAPPAPSGLAVQREGRHVVIPFDEVHAVHANAHYTYVFNGSAQLFCSLPIGDVEAMLPPDGFMRVHRSHIVNLARVGQVRRSGDNGMAELDSPVRCSVPVSRTRLSELRSRLALRQVAAE